MATVVGCLLGLNRELKGKPAGLRTHALVSLGAALMVVTALRLPTAFSVDSVGRVMQGVITGIGFLGAGVILRDATGKITGLTGAAMIWVAAALGMASGLGYWLEVFVATALIFLVLLLERWEHRLRLPLSPADPAKESRDGSA